jgi:hypothetical protein
MDISPETIIILLQSGVPAWVVASLIAVATTFKLLRRKK